MKAKVPISNRRAIVGILALLLVVSVFMSWRSDPKNGQVKYGSVESQALQVFDVPALVGKDINGVQSILGTPSADDSSHVWPNGNDEHIKTWTRHKVDLIVSFHSQTGQIIDFFLATDDPSGATKDAGRLYAQGNITESDPRYRIDIRSSRPDEELYTGVKIIPN